MQPPKGIDFGTKFGTKQQSTKPGQSPTANETHEQNTTRLRRKPANGQVKRNDEQSSDLRKEDEGHKLAPGNKTTYWTGDRPQEPRLPGARTDGDHTGT